MKHFFENIPGWFDYDDLYLEMIERFPSGHFVEVGAWKGKSAAFMAVEILKSGKDIRFDTVDHFIGVGPRMTPEQKAKRFFAYYGECLTNLRGVNVNVIPLASVEAANLYEDNSLDFVFIDANHAYPFVKKDIKVWLPKVKHGGVLAGHDYTNYNSVRKAVDEIFPNVKQVSDKCWMIEKK